MIIYHITLIFLSFILWFLYDWASKQWTLTPFNRFRFTFETASHKFRTRSRPSPYTPNMPAENATLSHISRNPAHQHPPRSSHLSWTDGSCQTSVHWHDATTTLVRHSWANSINMYSPVHVIPDPECSVIIHFTRQIRMPCDASSIDRSPRLPPILNQRDLMDAGFASMDRTTPAKCYIFSANEESKDFLATSASAGESRGIALTQSIELSHSSC